MNYDDDDANDNPSADGSIGAASSVLSISSVSACVSSWDDTVVLDLESDFDLANDGAPAVPESNRLYRKLCAYVGLTIVVLVLLFTGITDISVVLATPERETAVDYVMRVFLNESDSIRWP